MCSPDLFLGLIAILFPPLAGKIFSSMLPFCFFLDNRITGYDLAIQYDTGHHTNVLQSGLNAAFALPTLSSIFVSVC
jgi:hypothetical protein